MHSRSSTRGRRARSRGPALLALFVMASFGLGNTLPQMESMAEKLGGLSVPVAFLAAGCWYAYKDGGWILRIAASVLAGFALTAFGLGFMKGLHRAEGRQEIQRELTTIRDSLADDAAGEDLSADDARRNIERVRSAATRLQDSENEESAEVGRVLASIGERTRASEERLLAALEVVGSERFLDVPALLEKDDFEWQRATAKEYQAAAQASADNHEKLPQFVKAELESSELEQEFVQGFMAGFQRTWPLSARVYHAHLATAKLYAAWIAFVEERKAGVEVQDDGTVSFPSADDDTAYGELVERVTAAELETSDAADALQQALAKR